MPGSEPGRGGQPFSGSSCGSTWSDVGGSGAYSLNCASAASGCDCVVPSLYSTCMSTGTCAPTASAGLGCTSLMVPVSHSPCCCEYMETCVATGGAPPLIAQARSHKGPKQLRQLSQRRFLRGCPKSSVVLLVVQYQNP